MVKSTNKRIMITFSPDMLFQVEDLRSRSTLPFPCVLSTSHIVGIALAFYSKHGSDYGFLKESSNE